MAIAMRVHVVIVGTVWLCLVSTALAAEGLAVWHKPPYTPSSCYGNQDNGAMIAGVSQTLWNNKAACGKRYTVRCVGGANTAPHPCKQGTNVVVKIVDYCDKCTGDINLSQDAFSQIADLDAGKVKVQYDQV